MHFIGTCGFDPKSQGGRIISSIFIIQSVYGCSQNSRFLRKNHVDLGVVSSANKGTDTVVNQDTELQEHIDELPVQNAPSIPINIPKPNN